MESARRCRKPPTQDCKVKWNCKIICVRSGDGFDQTSVKTDDMLSTKYTKFSGWLNYGKLLFHPAAVVRATNQS